jgi:polysaccharide pyruvyl transferase CsaB
MPRILISGYYGFDNLGDDTVLFGILSAIRKLRPDAEMAVLSNQPQRTEELFGIPAFNRWSLRTILNQLKRCDLLVMGGGSLLQDVSSPRSVVYYLGIVLLAKMLGKPVVFYAQGFGPITRPFSKRLIKLIVNRVNMITVRDDKSERDLKSLGVTNPQIIVTADPALAIDTRLFPKEAGAELLKEFGLTPVEGTETAGRRLAGIAIRNWNTSHPFLEVLAKACDELHKRGWQVVFIPMQYPGDVGVSEKVASLMEEPSVLLNRQFTFRDISSIISNMDMIVGMRLHSLILAALYEVPFVPLSYDPKIDRFVHRLGRPRGQHVTEVTFEKLNQDILETSENLAQITQEMQGPLADLRREADKSGELAVKYLIR